MKRKEAPKFNTGEPCKRGHYSDRLVSNGRCCQCKKEDGVKYYGDNKEVIHAKAKVWRDDNPEKEKDRHAKYQKENPEVGRKSSAAWRKRNPEKVKIQSKAQYDKNPKAENVRNKAYRDANPEKEICRTSKWKSNNIEACRAYDARHAKDFPELYAAKSSKRRAMILQRIPSWATKEDDILIQKLFEKAKFLEEITGIKHHVDHIIPLQGKLVSGFHTPSNMEVITESENLIKNNKFDIEA